MSNLRVIRLDVEELEDGQLSYYVVCTPPSGKPEYDGVGPSLDGAIKNAFFSFHKHRSSQ
jgi:hypothetical protein